MEPSYALMKTSAKLELIHVIQMPSAGILLAVTSVTVVMMLVKIAHQVCTVFFKNLFCKSEKFYRIYSLEVLDIFSISKLRSKVVV